MNNKLIDYKEKDDELIINYFISFKDFEEIYRKLIPINIETDLIDTLNLLSEYNDCHGFKQFDSYTNKYRVEVNKKLVNIDYLENTPIYSVKNNEFSSNNEFNKILESLLNNYLNLRYSAYNKIIQMAHLASENKSINKEDYYFVVRTLSSFNLEALYYTLTIYKNINSLNKEIRLMSIISDYLNNELVFSNEDISFLEEYYDFHNHKDGIINVLKKKSKKDSKHILMKK